MTPSSPQEVAVLIPLVLALLTTLITIGVHAVALGATVQFVRREYQFRHAGLGFWTDVAIVAGVILLAQSHTWWKSQFGRCCSMLAGNSRGLPLLSIIRR